MKLLHPGIIFFVFKKKLLLFKQQEGRDRRLLDKNSHPIKHNVSLIVGKVPEIRKVSDHNLNKINELVPSLDHFLCNMQDKKPMLFSGRSKSTSMY